MMSVLCVAIFWVVNASSGEKSCLQFSIPTGSGEGGEGVVSHRIKGILGCVREHNTVSAVGGWGSNYAGSPKAQSRGVILPIFLMREYGTHFVTVEINPLRGAGITVTTTIEPCVYVLHTHTLARIYVSGHHRRIGNESK